MVCLGKDQTLSAAGEERYCPQEPTLQIRSKGLRRPLRHGLLPGMSQDGRGQERKRRQFSVEALTKATDDAGYPSQPKSSS